MTSEPCPRPSDGAVGLKSLRTQTQAPGRGFTEFQETEKVQVWQLEPTANFCVCYLSAETLSFLTGCNRCCFMSTTAENQDARLSWGAATKLVCVRVCVCCNGSYWPGSWVHQHFLFQQLVSLSSSPSVFVSLSHPPWTVNMPFIYLCMSHVKSPSNRTTIKKKITQ